MKVCSKCEATKEEDNFSFQNAAHTKRDSWCKVCRSKAGRDRHVPKPRIPPPARPGWVQDGIGYVPLTKGQVARVDIEDLLFVTQWNWFAYWNPHTKSFYAKRNKSLLRGDKSQKTITLHHVVLRLENSSSIVDHEDHDTLNDQKYNLRPATQGQNARNAKVRSDNTTGHKGITRDGRYANSGYKVSIRVDGEKKYFGTYSTLSEAIQIRTKVALEFHQEFAYEREASCLAT